MSVIELNTPRHAFLEYDREWVMITLFTWGRHYYFPHRSNYGWFKQCELRIYLMRVSMYNVSSMTCESGMDQANFVIKLTRKRVTQWLDWCMCLQWRSKVSACLPLQHVINQSVYMPPSTTWHQPKCLHASLYNMSSTKVSACLPLQHVINQSVCMPPSTSCVHMSPFNISSTTMSTYLSMTCHQPNCLTPRLCT